MSVEIKTRQLEIITAAGEILSESGISGLTTKKLAAKMGFAESALYRHYYYYYAQLPSGGYG